MQAVLRSFGEAVAAVNSTGPGALLKLLFIPVRTGVPAESSKTADRQ